MKGTLNGDTTAFKYALDWMIFHSKELMCICVSQGLKVPVSYNSVWKNFLFLIPPFKIPSFMLC